MVPDLKKLSQSKHINPPRLVPLEAEAASATPLYLRTPSTHRPLYTTQAFLGNDDAGAVARDFGALLRHDGGGVCVSVGVDFVLFR